MSVRVASWAVAVALVWSQASAASPEDASTPGFDPTGSHPLPNRSVEAPRRDATGGCGCDVARSGGFRGGAVRGILLLSLLARRVRGRGRSRGARPG